MKRYIFTERNGIYIIDLQNCEKVEEAYRTMRDIAAEGGDILFVGTKNKHKKLLKKKQLVLVCTSLTNVG